MLSSCCAVTSASGAVTTSAVISPWLALLFCQPTLTLPGPPADTPLATRFSPAVLAAVPLPVVTAKGEDALALLMRKTAEQAGIPVLRNVKLARSLHSNSNIYEYIPEDMMEQIAEVLKWAQKQKEQT